MWAEALARVASHDPTWFVSQPDPNLHALGLMRVPAGALARVEAAIAIADPSLANYVKGVLWSIGLRFEKPPPVDLPEPGELELESAMSPREAFFGPAEMVPAEEAVGRIAAELATPYPPGLLRELVRGRREILLLKKTYSVFANPSAEPLLDILDPEEVVVFGVATDVCNHAAISGLLDRGRSVTFVEDASRGLSEERVARCLAEWRERGVRFTTAAHVLAGW